MQKKNQQNKSDLVVGRAFFGDRRACAAYAALMRRVFDLDTAAPDERAAHDPAWTPFAYFDRVGHCVACVEAAVLGMILDGQEGAVTAIRLAAVDPDWRGQGLFRDLMAMALPWCEAEATGPTLLYTEDHALYERFGFRPLAQHAFVGGAPDPLPELFARAIDVRREDDVVLVRRLLATRSPVSNQCAIIRAPSLFLANVLAADDLAMTYAPALDALVVYELDDAITLVDIVAATIPSMAHILGALPARPAGVMTLFPPDRLAWHGEPVPDDTGLMARGTLPPAMCRPFMLPSTAGF